MSQVPHKDTEEAFMGLKLESSPGFYPKTKSSFGSMLFQEAPEHEIYEILRAFDYLSDTFPNLSTFRLYRRRTDDGFTKHSDTYSNFGNSILTVEEH